jgi:hypothetical protein
MGINIAGKNADGNRVMVRRPRIIKPDAARDVVARVAGA